METRKRIGLFLGPLLFILTLVSPVLPSNSPAHRLLAVFFLVVTWWVTECIPLAVTSLLIPVLITALGIAPVKNAFAPFAHPIIMLFLGSFILARAMHVHALDRKLAYAVLGFRGIAREKTGVLLALGLTAAFLSLWISNTATTAMMYPIALGVLARMGENRGKKDGSSFSVILLLSLAYSASIGGIGTPIGSPPNLIAIGMLENLTGYRMTFFQWMVIGFMVLIPMYAALFLLMRWRLRDRGAPSISGGVSNLEPRPGLNREQRNVLVAFAVAVFLWTFPGFVSLFWGRDAGVAVWFQSHFPESTAALIGATLLFLVPVDFKRGRFTLGLKDALKIDWGTLLLFGGGLSLGGQIFASGLADAIGTFFFSPGRQGNLSLITLGAIVLSVALTEVTSNTASANMIIPLIIAIAKAASINPLPPVLGSAIACSFAFLLPVATPPNAIIYGSRKVPLTKMISYGFWLELIGILIIWTSIRFLAPVLGLV